METNKDISKLCKQLDISSKTQKKRNSKQMRSTYESEIADFHVKIKELNLKPSKFFLINFYYYRICVMDETVIWNYAPLHQTYVPFDLPGYVQTPDVDHHDTLVVAIVGDGRKLPLYFIESKPAKRKNKQVIEKPVKGMTVEIMIK